MNKNSKLLSCVNCFSAGVFLALALLHIMPENEAQFNAYYEKKETHEEEEHHHLRRLIEDKHEEHSDHAHSGLFPLPNLMVFVGFVMILMTDRVFFEPHNHSHHEPCATSAVEIKPEEAEI